MHLHTSIYVYTCICIVLRCLRYAYRRIRRLGNALQLLRGASHRNLRKGAFVDLQSTKHHGPYTLRLGHKAIVLGYLAGPGSHTPSYAWTAKVCKNQRPVGFFVGALGYDVADLWGPDNNSVSKILQKHCMSCFLKSSEDLEHFSS